MDQYWNEFIHQSEDEEVVQGMDFIIFTKYILFHRRSHIRVTGHSSFSDERVPFEFQQYLA